MEFATPEASARWTHRFALALFIAGCLFHAWAMTVGWQSKNLPANEYRESQTALSAYWIMQDGDFSLAYPTPVLGKPWSIPMEFPLYQWTVVGTSRLTNWSLTKSGRAVSIACFYLALPAVFLLLRRWRIAVPGRWLVLALVVTCPLYIFYTRAFLIETMALMFSLWFWVAFERAVAERNKAWLAAAMLVGTAAALVKVTTFMLYLLPVGAWAGIRLWRERTAWKIELGWIVAAVALPFTAALWWVGLADRIKARNPLAEFLSSANLREFNFGTLATRFSAESWAMKGRIMSEEITWLPALAGATLLALGLARHRAAAVLSCVLVFLAALLLFPVLYALHDYYYVANALALLLAAGLALAGLAEMPRWRWLAAGLALVVCSAQAARYLQHYYPVQRQISLGGDALTDMLRAYTRPDEVLVITGQDWSSNIAYQARRRALMLRGGKENDEQQVDAALDRLAGEKIGAVIISKQYWEELSPLVRRLTAAGIAPRPWLVWRDCWIFFPEQRWSDIVQAQSRLTYPEMTWAPGAVRAPDQLGGQWRQFAELSSEQQSRFSKMHPAPIRFFTSFEPALLTFGTETLFGAHPWTRLVFWLPRGRHTLDTNVWFNPEAFTVPPGERPTDGVEIRLQTQLKGRALTLGEQLVDPMGKESDRRKVPVHFSFELEQDGEVELVFDPGKSGQDTRDWISIHGPLVIE